MLNDTAADINVLKTDISAMFANASIAIVKN